MTRKPLIVAISGPSCSGKTTLAKHLYRIIAGAVVLYQDDFAQPSELIPVHPVYKVQDWDAPEGAIDWAKQRETFQHLRDTGALPKEHQSHDDLNVQVPVPIADEITERWKRKFSELEGPPCVLTDGFLLYWDREVVKRFFDVRIFVREDYAVLKRRREERNGYFTQSGALWKDPDNYWDEIVWPAYTSSHEWMFEGGDVVKGAPDESHVSGLRLLEAGQLSMDEMVEQSCQAIYDALQQGTTAADYANP